MPKLVGLSDRGKADILSITLVGFLVFSTLTIASVTINPNIKQIFSPKAGSVAITDPMTGDFIRYSSDPEEIASYKATLAENDDRIIQMNEQEKRDQGIITSSQATTTNKGYYGPDAVNTKAGVNQVGYDCTKGGCAPGVEIAGYYRVGELYYPIGGTGNNPDNYKDTSLASINKANYENQMADKAAADAAVVEDIRNRALDRIDTIEAKKEAENTRINESIRQSSLSKPSTQEVPNQTGEKKTANTTTVTTWQENLGVAGGEDVITHTKTVTKNSYGTVIDTRTISTIPTTSTKVEKVDGGYLQTTTRGNLDILMKQFVGTPTVKTQFITAQPTASITVNPQGAPIIKVPDGKKAKFASDCQSEYIESGYCKEKPQQTEIQSPPKNQITITDQQAGFANNRVAYNPLPGNANQIGSKFTTPQLSQIYKEGTEACKNNPNSTECKNWNTQIENEFKTTVAALGGIFAAPAIITAGSLGGAVATGFLHLGAINSVQQTIDATVAQVEYPGSLEAWKQTGLAALSWANLGTSSYLIKTFSNTASSVQSLNLARGLNTGISGLNLVVDVPTAITTCTQEGGSVLDCAGSIVAVVADAGFGVMDYKQGQLSLGNPFSKIKENTITNVANNLNPSLTQSDPLAAAVSDLKPSEDLNKLIDFSAEDIETPVKAPEAPEPRPIAQEPKVPPVQKPKPAIAPVIETPAAVKPNLLTQAGEKIKETTDNIKSKFTDFVDNLKKPKTPPVDTNTPKVAQEPKPVERTTESSTLKPWQKTEQELRDERTVSNKVFSGEALSQEEKIIYDNSIDRREALLKASPEETKLMSNDEYQTWLSNKENEYTFKGNLQAAKDVKLAAELRNDSLALKNAEERIKLAETAVTKEEPKVPTVPEPKPVVAKVPKATPARPNLLTQVGEKIKQTVDNVKETVAPQAAKVKDYLADSWKKITENPESTGRIPIGKIAEDISKKEAANPGLLTKIQDWIGTNIPNKTIGEPPIKPGEVFDAQTKLEYIDLGDAAARADFKAKYSYQQAGLLEAEEGLIKFARENPDATFEQLSEEFGKYRTKYGFSNDQTGAFVSNIVEYKSQQNKVGGFFSQNPTTEDIYTTILGKKPAGNVVVEKGLFTVNVITDNPQDFSDILRHFNYTKEIPDGAKAITLRFNDDSDLPLIILQKYDHPIDPSLVTNAEKQIFNHEEHHAFTQLSDVLFNKDLTVDIQPLQKAMATHDEKLITLALQDFIYYGKKQAEVKIVDELTAFLKMGETDDFIYNKLTNPASVYDYYGKQKIGLASQLQEEFKNLTNTDKEIIFKILDQEYNNTEIKRALDAFNSLLEKGYTRDQALLIFEREELTNWPKVAGRTTSVTDAKSLSVDKNSTVKSSFLTRTQEFLQETGESITSQATKATDTVSGWIKTNIKDERGWLPKLRTENSPTPIVPIRKEIGTPASLEPEDGLLIGKFGSDTTSSYDTRYKLQVGENLELWTNEADGTYLIHNPNRENITINGKNSSEEGIRITLSDTIIEVDGEAIRLRGTNRNPLVTEVPKPDTSNPNIQLKSQNLVFEPSNVKETMPPTEIGITRPGKSGKFGTNTKTYSLGSAPNSHFKLSESSLADSQLVEITQIGNQLSVKNTTNRTITIDGKPCAPGQSVNIQPGSKIQANNTVSIIYNGDNSTGTPSFGYYQENFRVAIDPTPKAPLTKVYKVNGKNILQKAEEAEGLIVGQSSNGSQVLQRTNDRPLYYFDRENNAWVKADNIVLEDNLLISYSDDVLSPDINIRRDTPKVTIFKDKNGKFYIDPGSTINRDPAWMVPLQSQDIFTSAWNKIKVTTQDISKSPTVINIKGWLRQNIKDSEGWLPKLRTEKPISEVAPEVITSTLNEPYLEVAPPQTTNEKSWLDNLPIRNLKGGKMGDVFDMGEYLERYASHWNGQWDDEAKRIILTPETNSNILKNGEFFYDRSLSVVENGEIKFLSDSGYKPIINNEYGHPHFGDSDIPSIIDGEELVFRGINYEGMQSILQNNMLESGPTMKNVGKTGEIYFGQDSQRALSYAAEGEGYFAMATFEKPSYIISIKKPSSAEVDFLGDVVIRDPIPIDDILYIYEVRPYAMTDIKVPAKEYYTNLFGEKAIEPELYIPGADFYPLDGVPKAQFAYREISLDEAKAIFPEKVVPVELPVITDPKIPTAEVKPTILDNAKTFLSTSNGKLAVGAAVNIVGGTILGNVIAQNAVDQIPKAIDFYTNLWQGVLDQIKSVFPTTSDKLPESVSKNLEGTASVENSVQKITEIVTEQVPELPKTEEQELPSKTNVLILGDSITQGYLSDSLYKKLKATGYNIEFLGGQTSLNGIPTEGHGGYNTQAIVDSLKAGRWSSQLDKYTKPPVSFDKNTNLVVLELGVNDIGSKNNSDTVTIPNMKFIINYLRNLNPDIKIVITSVPNIYFNEKDFYKETQYLNSKLSELASQISTSKSPIVMSEDYSSKYILSQTTQSDGVHPNSYGAEIIAQSITDSILNNKLLEKTNTNTKKSTVDATIENKANEVAKNPSSIGIPVETYKQIRADGVINEKEKRMLYEYYYQPSPNAFIGTGTNYGNKNAAIATLYSHGTNIRNQMIRGYVMTASGEYGYHDDLLASMKTFDFIYNENPNRNDSLLQNQGSTVYAYLADKNKLNNGQPATVSYKELNEKQKRIYDLTSIPQSQFQKEKMDSIQNQSKLTPTQALASGKYVGIIATKSVNDIGRRFLLYQNDENTGKSKFLGVVLVGDTAKRSDYTGTGAVTVQDNADFINNPLGTRVQKGQSWGFDLTQDLYDYLGGTGGPVYNVTAVDPDSISTTTRVANSSVNTKNDSLEISNNEKLDSQSTTLKNGQFYSQKSPEWQDYKISFDTSNGVITKTLSQIGCGPTTVANILYENGIQTTPVEIAQEIPTNFWNPGGTSYQSNIELLEKNGYKTDIYIKSLDNLPNYIQEDQLIWISAKIQGFEHHTYIDGYTLENNKPIYNMRDPFYGSDLKCQASGSIFSCKNDSGQQFNYDTADQAVIILTPPAG